MKLVSRERMNELLKLRSALDVKYEQLADEACMGDDEDLDRLRGPMGRLSRMKRVVETHIITRVVDPVSQKKYDRNVEADELEKELTKLLAGC